MLTLYATPLSHFSRKVRVLLDAFGAPHTLADVGNVAATEAFGGNPLMQVPALRDGALLVIDSDVIAAHLVRRLDPGDRFGVLTTDPEALTLRAVMNAVMAREVTLILAERMGTETRGVPYFEKVRASMRASLAWLEARADAFTPESPGYAEFHLVCMVEHIVHYATVPLAYPRLRAAVDVVGALGVVRASAPSVDSGGASGFVPAASITQAPAP